MRIESELILPFKLPVKDGLKQLSLYPFAEICTEYKTICDGFNYELNNISNCRTKLLINYFPKDIENEKDSNTISFYFIKNILYHINKIIDAFRITYSIANLNRITISDLPTFIIISIDEKKHLYITRNIYSIEKPIINSAKDFLKVGSTISSMEIYPEVFLVDNFYESARTALQQERFPNVIVDIQTSFEIFIRNTLRLILKKIM